MLNTLLNNCILECSIKYSNYNLFVLNTTGTKYNYFEHCATIILRYYSKMLENDIIYVSLDVKQNKM